MALTSAYSDRSALLSSLLWLNSGARHFRDASSWSLPPSAPPAAAPARSSISSRVRRRRGGVCWSERKQPKEGTAVYWAAPCPSSQFVATVVVDSTLVIDRFILCSNPSGVFNLSFSLDASAHWFDFYSSNSINIYRIRFFFTEFNSYHRIRFPSSNSILIHRI